MNKGGRQKNTGMRALSALLLILLIFRGGITVPTHTITMAADGDSKGNRSYDGIGLGGVGTESSIFKDVSTSNPHFPAIQFLLENGHISGTGNGNFRPDDYITTAEAITILERLYGDPTLLPDNWEEWNQPHYSYPAKWFDPLRTQGMYANTYVTRDTACAWILAILEMQRLPGNMYYYPEDMTGAGPEAFWTMHIYGYQIPGNIHTLGNEYITRAEFCDLVVWAGDIAGKIPEPHISLPVEVAILTYGYETEYMANINNLIVQDTLLLLPETMLGSFADNGYTIKMMPRQTYNEYVNEKYGPAYVDTTAGLYVQATETRQGEIVINLVSEDTVLHEMGHYVYYNVLESPADAEKQFENEDELEGLSWCLKSSYCRKSVKEFFAEAFVAYVKTPELMQARAPGMYSLIDSLA